jgi:hypothetical protein
MEIQEDRGRAGGGGVTYNEFKLCKGCPVKGARYFDPDGYWCCRHPDAAKHQYPFNDEDFKDYSDRAREVHRKQHEERDPVESPIPFVCMKSCPVDHWKRTIEGGQIPKGQIELITDAERMA